jgi:hypothetical protein
MNYEELIGCKVTKTSKKNNLITPKDLVNFKYRAK